MTTGAALTPSTTPAQGISNDGGLATLIHSRCANIYHCPFGAGLRYRAYRNPLVMFVIGPAYLFILRYRLPVGLFFSGRQPWLSTMATNIAIAAVAAGLIWLMGIWPFLFVELPILLLAGSLGVWLFYVQHQFEMTFWAHGAGWSSDRSGPAWQLAL